jgi:Ca2+-binding EF-hand superfamily protein
MAGNAWGDLMEQTKLSPLQARKFTTLFAHFDTNGDGVLSEADFRQQAQRIQQSFGWSNDEKRTRRLFESRSELFQRLASGADKDRDGTVTLAEFLRYFERQLLAYRAAGVASPWLVSSCRDLIELIDQDGSCAISASEYGRLLSAMGSDADPQATFARLDRNQDGKLTLDELIGLSLEFLTSDDPEAAGNFFFCGKV